MPLSTVTPRRLRGLSLLALMVAGVAGSASALAADLLDLDYRPLASKQQVNLQQRYHGQVLLVVNTASKCGYTPQYEGLEALQKRYAGRGFAVLGFPSMISRGRNRATKSRSRISARSPTGSSSRCSRRCMWSARRRRRSING